MYAPLLVGFLWLLLLTHKRRRCPPCRHLRCSGLFILSIVASSFIISIVPRPGLLSAMEAQELCHLWEWKMEDGEEEHKGYNLLSPSFPYPTAFFRYLLQSAYLWRLRKRREWRGVDFDCIFHCGLVSILKWNNNVFVSFRRRHLHCEIVPTMWKFCPHLRHRNLYTCRYIRTDVILNSNSKETHFVLCW